jgi:hypothetical protein
VTRARPRRPPPRPGVLFRAVVLTAATAAAGARPAPAEEIDEGVRFKSVLVQGNPLGFAIGRYSADLEYLPAPHHAMHLTPLYEYALPGTDDQLTGFGAEIGYRFYTGWHGPHGFFAGASFLVGEFEYIHGNPMQVVGDTANDTQFVQLGGALDVGYQAIILGNFCFGLGGGVQYTVDTTQPKFEYQNHPWHDLVYGWGLRPRILLQVGAAF